MGLLLTLLIPGCERDAPVCIDPYPDEALFYLHYSPGANPFLDYVVPLMAASSHKPSVISAVVQGFGIPLWDVERSFTAGDSTIAVIPMKCADTDSLAAFMALYGTPQGVWYRMYGREPASPAGGTLEDLFMHYQSSLFGNGATRSKRTVPFSAPKGQPGYVVEVTTCWEVYTSLDGGRSWEYQYTACNTASTWIGGGGSTPEGTSLGGSYTGGEGGGTTGGGTDNADAPTLAGISPRAILAVYNLRDRLVQAYCPNARIFEAEWNSGLTIRINPALPSGHLGRSGPNTIEFKTMAAITDQTLLHELFHQYQDTYYGSYTATQLREFETYLLVDLYLFFQNYDLTWILDTNDELQDKYNVWLNAIEENGINSTTLKDYPYWFNQFMEAMKNTEYKNYPVGTHTQPDAIRQTFQLCHFNQ